MAAFSDEQIASVARKAGLSGQGLAIAVAVCLAESGGETTATNNHTNGSVDKGLWQINSVHAALIAGRDLFNPDINAQLMAQLSGRGSNWRPWSTYKSGAHTKFMGRGAKAAGMPDVPYDSAGGGGAGGGGALDFSGITTPLSFLTNPGMWLRVGVFILGGLLLLMGIAALAIGGGVSAGAKLINGKAGSIVKRATKALPTPKVDS